MTKKATTLDDVLTALHELSARIDALCIPPIGEREEMLELRGRITPRDAEVLDLVTAGFTNREIGKKLEVGERTIKAHIFNIIRRLKINSHHPRVMLARYWSWPIFRIGAGYESPKPASAPVLLRKRLRS
jgi:DNA-binding NarL/FixJ family response regulator